MSRGKSCFSIGSQSYYSARSAHLLCRPYKNVEGRKSSHNNFKPIDRRSFLRYHNHNISDLLIGFPAFLPYLRNDSIFYRRYGRLLLFSHLLTARRSGKAGYLWEYRKLDKETMEVIAAMTGNRKLMEDLEAYRTSEESYDLCEAMKGIQEEGIEIGRELGRKQGIEQGIRGMAELFQELGLPDERIIGKLSEKFSMSRQKAEKMLAGIKR